MLTLIAIFASRQSITSVGEANAFLASAGQGYLIDAELKKISALLSSHNTFQAPNEISNFTGRKRIITKIVKDVQNDTARKSKIIYIHGLPGVGKTALAIKLGHMLRDIFPDGVLWYKVDSASIGDILLSVATTFGEDIRHVEDVEVRSSIVCSILSSKDVLLVLDSGELCGDIHLLIPNSPSCTTIITSQKSDLKAQIRYEEIFVRPFTDKETLFLFQEILKEKYPRSHKVLLLKVAQKVGHLPLALHIIARQLLHKQMSIVQLQKLIESNDSVFHDMFYENRNLDAAISVSYEKLDVKRKSVLASASVFKGKDFSGRSIGCINGLPFSNTSAILQSLVDLSLLEHSTRNRYRIHPSIREFVREKLDYPRSSYLLSIAIVIFTFFATWWGVLHLFVDRHDRLYYYFSASYGVMALYGGLCGVHTSFKWGGLKTLLGKAIFMFSIGLFLQECGQVAYSYYTNVHHIQVPYPSLGDIGYFGTIPFYTYGALSLAKSSGIKLTVQSFKKKIVAIAIPSVLLLVSYMLFLRGYTFIFDNPIKIFLDFAYPLGEAIYISLATIIFIFSRSILDGIMRSKAFLILVALVAQFVADYVFLSYSSEFYSGSFIDILYLISYFVMTLALLNLKSLQVRIKILKLVGSTLF